MDRFAAFFVCPLFTESATSRELNAVHSEHAKNLQSDLWRGMQVVKSLARNDHPYSQFSTGNLETLQTEPASKEPMQVESDLQLSTPERTCPLHSDPASQVTVPPFNL